MTEAVRRGGDEFSGAALTAVAASLRWSRPDLTAGLAGHAADVTPDTDPVWLLATGWRLHGLAATGDARAAVGRILGALTRRGVDAARPDGARLLVEIAAVSQDNGDTAIARRLGLRALALAGGSAELRLDARVVLLRCAVAADESAAVAQLLDEARGDAAVLAGAPARATVELAEAVVAQEKGLLEQAAEAADRGVRALAEVGGRVGAPHLHDGLLALRIGALLDGGRQTAAREVARGVLAEVSGQSSRLTAPLWLAVARATMGDVAEADGAAAGTALAAAAECAAAVDAPGLEAVCRTALAEQAERTGALDVALREMRAGMAAEQQDRERGRRHRELVAEFEAVLPPASSAAQPGAQDMGGADPHGADRGGSDLSSADLSSADLSGADLSGADRGGADLSGADRGGADPASEPTPTGRQPTAAPRPDPGRGGMSAIDALLGGLVAEADAWLGEPLAEPRPAGGARHSSDPLAGAEHAGEPVNGPGAPPEREARAATVPTEQPEPVGRGAYGALLGDALISELRASGRWSDEGDRAGTWPRLARNRDGGTVLDPAASPGSEATPDAGATATTRNAARRENPETGHEPAVSGRAARRRAAEAAARRDPATAETADEPTPSDALQRTLHRAAAARSARSGRGSEQVSGRRAAQSDGPEPAEVRGTVVGAAAVEGIGGAAARADTVSADEGPHGTAGAAATGTGPENVNGEKGTSRHAAGGSASDRDTAAAGVGTRHAAGAEGGTRESAVAGRGVRDADGVAGRGVRDADGADPGVHDAGGADPSLRETAGEGAGPRASGGSVARAGAGSHAGLRESAGAGARDDAVAGGGDGAGVDRDSHGAAGEASSADDWLREAIAELDRLWGRADAAAAVPDPVSGPGPDPESDPLPSATATVSGAAGGAHAAPEAPPVHGERRAYGVHADGVDAGLGGVGSTVVIDLVDGERRLHSPQAERVLRDLTDRMRVHLPSRGRVRTEDPATLRVDLPGRGRAESAAWLHPVMRDLAGAVAGAVARDPIDLGDLRETRLRGTVHGTDGELGVRLLQELPEPRDEPETPTAQPVRVEEPGRSPAGGRRHRSSDTAGHSPAGQDTAGGDTAGGDTADLDTAGGGPEQGREPSSGGRRRTRGALSPHAAHSVDPDLAPTAEPTPGSAVAQGPSAAPEPESTPLPESPAGGVRARESLGDLLAGAMAAYRGL